MSKFNENNAGILERVKRRQAKPPRRITAVFELPGHVVGFRLIKRLGRYYGVKCVELKR